MNMLTSPTVTMLTSPTVTMSSREIAELTGKQHQHVKRNIEKTLLELGEDVSSFGRIYFDSMNREQTEYRLDRELTETLLLGYSAPLRLKVIRRLREMEESLAGSRLPTTAEGFANAFRMLADAELRQAQQDQAIKEIDAKVDLMAQSLTILDKLPPNGELVTHLRKRVSKKFGISFDVIDAVLDRSEMHPKFAVRNHHENADGSVNYGYWKREVNSVFTRFVDECQHSAGHLHTHPYVEGRFKLVRM